MNKRGIVWLVFLAASTFLGMLIEPMSDLFRCFAKDFKTIHFGSTDVFLPFVFVLVMACIYLCLFLQEKLIQAPEKLIGAEKPLLGLQINRQLLLLVLSLVLGGIIRGYYGILPSICEPMTGH
jgi:hypothetical protein